MKSTSWLALAIIVMLAIFLTYQNFSRNNATSSEEQISALILDAKSAIESKDYRRTISYISHDYSDNNGMTLDSLRSTIISAYREPYKYSIVIDKSEIKVNGNIADTVLGVKVYASSDGTNYMVFDGTITLKLANEPTRRWIIFPTRRWRVISATGLPHEIMED